MLTGPEFEAVDMRRAPAGRICSSADAELVALENGVEEEGGPLRQKDERRKRLWRGLLKLGRASKSVVIKFVNNHVGIPRNEIADMMATDTLRVVHTRQDEIPIPLTGIKAKISE